MPQHAQLQPVRTPPIGTAIQVAADLLMELVANECAEAKQDTDPRLVHLTDYIDDYKRSVRATQQREAQKLASAHRQIHELEHRLSDLQGLKRADETMLPERMYLHTELSALTSQDPSARNSSSPVDISDLARYGIIYCGRNALSFGDQWLQLWNQYVSEDPHDPGLSPSDRITPKELIILLDNFSSQVRRGRNTIESQRETIANLQKERAYLFQLCSKDPKQQTYPAAVEVDVGPISQHQIQGIIEDNQSTDLKSEGSSESLNSPGSHTLIDPRCTQPS
ncbi:hypothetical protein CPB84DRAFT_1763285 [Gymnopilus junonius]|uniref:Uncharacterized protein n=1 Tax=Gymnopilus junonius TaxID=109634 RepID=A0A9P5P0H8_GYMJU|nr:hypothetical protein CPB84DRAFT_1763285 [Gymnopilus junonius]